MAPFTLTENIVRYGAVMNVAGAILAGGKSRRMGRDKAALVLPGGAPLLRRTAQVVQSACATVLIVGRTRPDDWPEPGMVFVPDAAPDQGPAGGLLAALRHAGGPVLLLPCDIPHLSVDTLHWLTEMFAVAQTTCAASIQEQVQPLFAVYTLDCLPRLEARLADGKRSLVGLLEDMQAAIVDAPPWVAEAITDVDTPDDWARATRAAA